MTYVAENGVRVLVGEGSAMVRELLVGALRRKFGFHVVGTGSTLAEVLECARDVPTDTALISSPLSDGRDAGLDAVTGLHRVRPEIRSILILNDEDDAATLAAFRGGAWAVLSRSRTNLVVISECILRINGGEMWVTPRQTRLLVDALSASQSPPASQPVVSAGMGLTVREQQVLRSLADGMSNREIALHLGVSEHTVKNHLFRIFDKLGVSTRLEAALFAVSDVPTRTRIECEPLETIA